VFKVAGENEDSTYVQVYSPIAKEVLDKPTDPFMSFKKVGKCGSLTKRSRPRPGAGCGQHRPVHGGRGYFVSIAASTKVCSKAQALQLSKSIK